MAVVKNTLGKYKKFYKNLQGAEALEAIIGFLGNEKNARDQGGQTNLEIAYQHTFGVPSKNLPKRSPFIGFKMKDKTQEIKDVVLSSLKQSLSKGSLTKEQLTLALKRGGLAGENLIDETIETKGFGTYAPLKQSTIDRKSQNKDKILIETGQLKDSRVSKVIKKTI